MERFATPQELETGEIVRTKPCVLHESENIQRQNQQQLLSLDALRHQKKQMNKRLNKLNREIDNLRAQLQEKESEKKGIEEERQELVHQLGTIDPEMEKESLYETKVHNGVNIDMELELRELIRDHRMCRITTVNELFRLQRLNMYCSPIIEASEEDLIWVAITHQCTQEVLRI